MEIPAEYRLTMGEIELNQDPATRVVTPYFGRKHGHVYTPESTGVSHYEDPHNILRDLTNDDFRSLIGPIIDRGHFARTGELRELELLETTVLFWNLSDVRNSGGEHE